MFRCKDIAEHASAYVGHELSWADRVKFRLHLFICHDCRQFIAQFRLTLGALRGLKKTAAAQNVNDQVAALLRAQKNKDSL